VPMEEQPCIHQEGYSDEVVTYVSAPNQTPHFHARNRLLAKFVWQMDYLTGNNAHTTLNAQHTHNDTIVL